MWGNEWGPWCGGEVVVVWPQNDVVRLFRCADGLVNCPFGFSHWLFKVQDIILSRFATANVGKRHIKNETIVTQKSLTLCEQLITCHRI